MDQRWAVMFNSRASTRTSCERGACQSLGCQHLHHGRVHACSVGEPFARPTLLRDCSLHMCRPEATQVLPSEHLFNLCRWNASEVWGKATAHTTALHKRPGRSFRWSAITDGAPTMCLTCGSGVNQTDAVFGVCGAGHHAEFKRILLSGGWVICRFIPSQFNKIKQMALICLGITIFFFS